MRRQDVRNVAIIAHVDHGKTTLVDALLRETRAVRQNQTMVERVMDSTDLERERGITILAKNTAVRYKDVKINIVDTPGHADFGGEVERVLNMVDGVLLLVDAVEGPMPQTRFVLRKALELGHRAVVVVNKLDREYARPEWAVDATFDLFIDLGASDEQAEFEVVYASALRGFAGPSVDALADDMDALLDAVLRLPAPLAAVDEPLQLLITNFEYDEYRGRIALGRITKGTVRRSQEVAIVTPDTAPRRGKVGDLFVFENLGKVAVESADAGDIVAFSGLEDVGIGETICDPLFPDPLPPIAVEAPTVRMGFTINTSPLAGREGKFVTSRHLRARLQKELERNVALRVEDTDSADRFLVSGRGELHLGILIETMRREGYEFAVGRPQVIVHDVDGVSHEPYEEVYIDVADGFVGAVMDMFGRRRAELLSLQSDAHGATTTMRWLVPTRGLLGFRSKFLSATSGTGVMHTLFAGYRPWAGDMEPREFGSIVAHEPGLTTSYALDTAQQRGALFVGPGVEVYAGMVVGVRPKAGDLAINVCRRKHVTNHRQSFAEIGVLLTPPVVVSLDMAMEYIDDDELIEITPLNIRLRKVELDHNVRARIEKDARKQA
ncbi:MAG: translational GTPase TypA [Anaerolineae bacterium]